jgi:hypothetical protein
MHCHVCVGRVVVSLLFVLVRGVVVVCCISYVLVFIVRLCGSTLFRHCLLAKNKIK